MRQYNWTKLKNHDRNLIGAVLLAVLTYTFGIVLRSYPSIAEDIYYRHFFCYLRIVYDNLIGWLPIPMFYVVIGVAIAILFHIIFQIIRGNQTWITGIKRLTTMILFLYTAFYWVWGYNYARPSITSLLELPEIRSNTESIIKEADHMTLLLNKLYPQKGNIPPDIEDIIEREVSRLLTSWGYPTSNRGRMRKIYPDGLLLRFSTSGMYFPHALEGMVDSGLHDLQIPSTMAHEYGHVYGFGEESTCNLIAVLACLQSDVPYIQYSGMLSYWRYLTSHLSQASPPDYKRIHATLDAGVADDLTSIRNQMNKYPDIMPAIRDMMYDNYLKSQGIADGIQSYSYVIDLMHMWKQSSHNREIYKEFYIQEK